MRFNYSVDRAVRGVLFNPLCLNPKTCSVARTGGDLRGQGLRL